MRVEVCKSIEPIQEAWDRIAPRDGVALESRHLLAIERAKVSGIDPYYLLAYDATRLAGIIHGFVMKLDVASIDKSVPAEALATLRHWNPGFLNEPVFECGIVAGLGETIACDAADFPEVSRLAAREMTRLAREAGAEFVLVRDVPYGRLAAHAGFLEEGYAPLLGYPLAMMPVRWPSFDGYLAALKSGARKQILPLLTSLADVEIEIVRDFGPHAARLATLWQHTNAKAADYTHETLTTSYFAEIARQLPDRSHVIAAKRNGAIVAFILCLLGDSEYFGIHCGLDYDACGDDNIYLRVHLAMLRDALTRGARSVNLGITTYDVKFKRGFEAEPMVYLVKHVRQPRLTLALARSLQKGIKQPENSHRPFKDQDLASRPSLTALAASLPVTPPPPASDLFSKVYAYDRTNNLRLGDIYSFCPVFESAQGPTIRRRREDVVMLGANAYLGLGTHPALARAAQKAIDEYGTGSSGSPLLNGTLELHADLARALAEFMGKEEALLFSTGYQTNVGVVSALLGRDDVVIMDRLDHASLVDGARLAGAEIIRFRHNDMDALEQILRRYPDRGKFVIVDSVYSMEGTIADLPTIVDLARRYGARTMVDEAHGLGVLGPGGRGAAEQLGVLDKVDVVMGSLSKALAAAGGFVAAESRVIDYLRHVARSHVFSTSLPPPTVATARAALEIVKSEPERRRQVLANAEHMSKRLEALGYDAPYRGTAIVPVHCGNDAVTLGAFKWLLENGVFVNPVLDPAVPKGRELLRTSYMATHTEEMLDRAAAVFSAARSATFPTRRAAATAKRSLHVRPMLVLPAADRFSFYDHYLPQSAHGRLRVPGFTRLQVGEAVDCGISFDKEQMILQSQGKVVSKALVPLAEAPLGIEVELLAGETSARSFVDSVLADQAHVPARRRCWRYHADIDVEVSTGGVRESGVVDDISLEGMSIRSRVSPDCGARISVRLKPPSGAPLDIVGEVRWRRDGDDPAFGVEFRFESPDEREGVQSLITAIRREIAETAPDGVSPR